MCPTYGFHCPYCVLHDSLKKAHEVALTKDLLVFRTYSGNIGVPELTNSVNHWLGSNLGMLAVVRHAVRCLPPYTSIFWEDVKAHKLMLDARESLHQTLMLQMVLLATCACIVRSTLDTRDGFTALLGHVSVCCFPLLWHAGVIPTLEYHVHAPEADTGQLEAMTHHGRHLAVATVRKLHSYEDLRSGILADKVFWQLTTAAAVCKGLQCTAATAQR